MVIKVEHIASNHGHNAINYAMNKNKQEPEEMRPEFLACNYLLNDDVVGRPVDATAVWMSMRLRQEQSIHKVKDGFFRIEICPSAEESEGWGRDDWQRCLDDAIRHLDNVEMTNKNGKVFAHKMNLKNAQWIATIHRDTDNTHIHLIANRITEDNKLQDANKCKDRGVIAANNMAQERGWVKAEDMLAVRKGRIHQDALEVLRSMSTFNLSDYFKGMDAKGWIVEPRYDSQSRCVGYSIGENLYKTNGKKSSTVLIPASKLGYGRDLMVSKLESTWNKVHKSQAAVIAIQKPSVQTEEKPTVKTKTPIIKPQPQAPKWSCSVYEARNSWNQEGWDVRIPDKTFKFIGDEIPDINKIDYYDEAKDIPNKAEVIAVAVYEFLVAADAVTPSGGGGGSNNDLRWDGLTEDDLKKMAQTASQKAVNKCMAGLHKRRGLHL